MSKAIIKSPEQLDKVRESGKAHKLLIEYLHRNLIEYSKNADGSMSTYDVELLAQKFCKENDIIPAQVGYQGYPFVICCGVNSDGVHTMPHTEKKIRTGDILSLDTTVRVNEYCADGGFCMGIGEIDEKGRKIIQTSRKCLSEAIKLMRGGRKIDDISSKIYSVARKAGFEVLRDYAGHGIGKNLHEEPFVANYPMGEKGKLETGTVLAMDILLVEGEPEVQNLRDGWSTKVKDGGRFAFSEKTVIVHEDKAEIVNDFSI